MTALVPHEDSSQLTVSRTGDLAVVVLRGDIDLGVVGPVRAGLREVFVEGGSRDVQVDLSQVRFIDSSGIGVLVWAFKQARVFQVDFALVGPSPEVSQVLRVLGLDRIITILPAGTSGSTD